MEPVERRWEESEGKYLHKKFKKMASASSVAEPPMPPPPPREASPVTPPPAASSQCLPGRPLAPPPPQAHAFPLKHSALSMLSSPPLRTIPPSATAVSGVVDQGRNRVGFFEWFDTQFRGPYT